LVEGTRDPVEVEDMGGKGIELKSSNERKRIRYGEKEKKK
jgi:hypothetical protein